MTTHSPNAQTAATTLTVTPWTRKPDNARNVWRTPMSKISLTDKNGTYTIDLFYPCENLSDVFDYLVVPVLLAAGFSRKSIDAYMDNEPE